MRLASIPSLKPVRIHEIGNWTMCRKNNLRSILKGKQHEIFKLSLFHLMASKMLQKTTTNVFGVDGLF
jgi:hypothetical protein